MTITLARMSWLAGITALMGFAACSSNSNSGGAANNDAGASSGSSGTADPNGTYQFTSLTGRPTSATMEVLFAAIAPGGAPATDLKTIAPEGDLAAYEDGQKLPADETPFKLTHLALADLDLRTNIVLDTSGSVEPFLADIKTIGKALIDASEVFNITATVDPNLRIGDAGIAVSDGVIFLGTPPMDVGSARAPATDKAAGRAFVDGLKANPGKGTWLYGALEFSRAARGPYCQDGSGVPPPRGVPKPGAIRMTHAIVVTDGRDSVGGTTLADALKRRGDQLVTVIGVGDELDEPALKSLATFGYYRFKTYGEAVAGIDAIKARLKTLPNAVYKATYTTPKASGDHVLELVPKGGVATASPANGMPHLCSVPAGFVSAASPQVCRNTTNSSMVLNAMVTCADEQRYGCGANCYADLESMPSSCPWTACAPCATNGSIYPALNHSVGFCNPADWSRGGSTLRVRFDPAASTAAATSH